MSVAAERNRSHYIPWIFVGGFAIGLASGLVPGPLQMVTATLFAVPLRKNLPVALLVPRLPKTMAWTLTAVPQSSGMLLSLR